MARTIWKYPLSTELERQAIMVPAGAELLSVGAQGDQLCLWATVDPSRALASVAAREVTVVGTGWTMPDGIYRFIGTAQKSNGTVWHVFEG